MVIPSSTQSLASSERRFENTIAIRASATVVERCITELPLMTQWLNPMLTCEPIGGAWSTDIGSKSQFVINLPLLRPTLQNVVIDRAPGLVVWQFQGFFTGTDRWECDPLDHGTRLINCFTFEIPNPLIRFGFDRFAQDLTRTDMEAQLKRLKVVAETLEQRLR